MRFDFTGAPIPTVTLRAGLKRLQPLLKKAAAATYVDDVASLAVLDDLELLDKSYALAKHCKDVDLLIICGIGGSNLGTLAIAQACLGADHALRHKPRVLYADTVDPSHTAFILAELTRALKAKQNVVLCIISKSGTTTETVALATVLLEPMRSYDNYRDDVVVITDTGSKLWHVTKQEGFHILEIPKSVGGRYSVFTPVGLFPLAVMGIDIQELLKGAIAARSYCLRFSKDNPAAMGAITLAAQYQKQKKRVHDTFVFSHRLEGVGKWYRQLLAESCGKERNRKGRKVNAGITPTVSVGSVDLHSVGQLYIDGPNDKITTFIDIDNEPSIKIPHNKGVAMLVDHIQGKELHTVMRAILEGTAATYKAEKRAHWRVTLPDTKDKTIGELLQTLMMQTIFFCHLIDVNAFDQPAVEKYKANTRGLLAK